jgi:hypothetical protein
VEPGWDRDAHVAACMGAISGGTSPKICRNLFGDDVFQIAVMRISFEKPFG